MPASRTSSKKRSLPTQDSMWVHVVPTPDRTKPFTYVPAVSSVLLTAAAVLMGSRAPTIFANTKPVGTQALSVSPIAAAPTVSAVTLASCQQCEPCCETQPSDQPTVNCSTPSMSMSNTMSIEAARALIATESVRVVEDALAAGCKKEQALDWLEGRRAAMECTRQTTFTKRHGKRACANECERAQAPSGASHLPS